MAFNVIVKYNGGLLPDIILLTQRYYHHHVWSQYNIKSMDQPGKVANPARGQLNRENEYS